ncbi:MAG: 8-oxo-dGTP diphosphatase [Methanobacterium sp.]|jgi:8-oxo-dGTP diphosphatase|uniref:NUDIX domain-containing protein n=1 Tax=Methanobacterium sp. TaxID=2164 RepID=UPI0003C96217|nr:NUDIX hydrolase [Methanobacterium sp.]MDI3550173.1 8-oxo-dGTP diphosphatase [Methanobacterium sp.]CDG66001.1 NUDIX hydrolase [Methanobacterium sp. MB1]
MPENKCTGLKGRVIIKNYKQPRLTVDAAVTTADHKIIFIKRKNPPYKGSWALPGGFVEYGETVEDAVIREVKEETGVTINIDELLGVYSDPERDPRGHTITVCYLATKEEGKLEADTDASEVACFTVEEAMGMQLAFDHNKILQDALDRWSKFRKK